jgi:tetratricopeptide (TPR) repeat protein
MYQRHRETRFYRNMPYRTHRPRTPLPLVVALVLVSLAGLLMAGIALATPKLSSLAAGKPPIPPLGPVWPYGMSSVASARPGLVPTFTPTAIPATVPAAIPPVVADVADVSAPAEALLPTPTPVPVALEPTPEPALRVGLTLAEPQPGLFRLEGFRHAWQTWNNCGPATLSFNLSYYGSTLDQATIGAVLRRHPDDKNVGPHELAAYARSQGFQAQVRVDGSAELARLFLSNHIPLLIETWLPDETFSNGMGHYRLLTGYDDNLSSWILYDSYVSTNLVNPNGPYQGIYMTYAETDRNWSVFNYTYVLIYTAEQETTVRAILGDAFEETGMWQAAAARAQAMVDQQPNDAIAWFNWGTVLTHQGHYELAAAAFDQARAIGLPWRMLWYQFGPFEAYHAVGRYSEVAELAERTLASTGGGGTVEELHYWRGQALASLGDIAGARAAWQRALELNPDSQDAAAALSTLQG